MPKYELTIIASGLSADAEDLEIRFLEAGCADVTVSVQRGAIILAFHRDAKSFLHALVSAIDCTRRAGATVERIEPDHLVSPTEIAKRAGLTRAAITNYSLGRRAPNFPCPVARVTTLFPLWDWVPVARWLYHQGWLTMDEVLQAKLIRVANIALDLGVSHHANLVKRLQQPARERVEASA